LADSNETNSSALPAPVKFLAATGWETGEETALEAMTPPPMLGHRKYRRLPKPRTPHTWGTRPDPFEAVWAEITQRLAERPEGIRLHDARHTHATMMLKGNVSPKVVSERLGHSTVSLTLDVYSHVIPGLHEAAALRFDEMRGRTLKLTNPANEEAVSPR
jgi:integrase